MPDNSKTNNISPVATDPIKDKIYTIRGMQVMLDRDLAVLYAVEARALNQAVKRNQERFPKDYCFQLTDEELQIWKSQIVITNSEKMGLRRNPFAFTERGIAMLSTVLHSKTSISVSMRIMDAFVFMRQFIADNSGIFQRLDRIEMASLEFRSETKPSPSTKLPTKT